MRACGRRLLYAQFLFPDRARNHMHCAECCCVHTRLPFIFTHKFPFKDVVVSF